MRLFLDTDGLLASMDTEDHAHLRALDLLSRAREKVTHNFVIAEMVAHTTNRFRRIRQPVLTEVIRLLDRQDVDVHEADKDLLREALYLLRNRYNDKLWSLCDMVSFVLMKRLGIDSALTRDEDFAQARFRCLLREDG